MMVALGRARQTWAADRNSGGVGGFVWPCAVVGRCGEFPGARIQAQGLVDQVGREVARFANGDSDAVAGFMLETGGSDGGTVSDILFHAADKARDLNRFRSSS